MTNNLRKDEKQHIAIIGGGMVGISLALLLSRQLDPEFVSITLIEQFSFPASSDLPVFQPSFDDRSTALSAGSIDILNSMDCWTMLQKSTQKIESIHVSDRGHIAGATLQASEYNIDALGYVVENRRMGQVLLHRLQQQAVKCLAPATVLSCQPKRGAYSLQVKNNDEEISLDVDLVLIADGAESAIRQSLGIDVEVKDYHQSALVANVSLDRPHNGVAYERFTDEGPIALLPLPPLENTNRAALVWTLPTKKQEYFTSVKQEELLEKLQQRFGYRAGNILGIGERHTYPLQLVQAKEQVRSNLVVVGNAAHFLHPVAGQGFNLALRDCSVLADCLLNAFQNQSSLGNYSVLSEYVTKQEKDQDVTIYMTDQLVKLFSSSRLPYEVLRQLGFMGLNALLPLKNQFAQKMMGLGV
jgi:2-polyprenyl-6-methoxyphenol 4-hydroxylase